MPSCVVGKMGNEREMSFQSSYHTLMPTQKSDSMRRHPYQIVILEVLDLQNCNDRPFSISRLTTSLPYSNIPTQELLDVIHERG